jgi:hypothetical protein
MLPLRPSAEASDDSLYARIFTFFFHAGEHRTETLDFIISFVCHGGCVYQKHYMPLLASPPAPEQIPSEPAAGGVAVYSVASPTRLSCSAIPFLGREYQLVCGTGPHKRLFSPISRHSEQL